MSVEDIRTVLGLKEKAARAEYIRLKDVYEIPSGMKLSYFHFCVHYEKLLPEVRAKIASGESFEDLKMQ